MVRAAPSQLSPAASRSRLAWALIAIGLVARLVLAFATEGVKGDLAAASFTEHALATHGLGVYEPANATGFPHWPYPPGLFPWLLGARGLADLTGLAFENLFRLAPIACDAAIALLVYDHLGSRGMGERSRLLGTALIALGVPFVGVSGFHGQLDSVAILPALAALVLWERMEPGRRPYVVGALIGIGAAVKTVPLLMLLAVVPAARGLREGATVAAVAVAIPAVLLAPFWIAEPTGTGAIFSYHGGPGLGGLSLLAAPDAPTAAFGIGPGKFSRLGMELYDHARLILGGALLASGAFLLRYRPRPLEAACLVWLVIYVFGVTFFIQYAVWGLPFFVLAGYLRAALVLELVLLPATLVAYRLVPRALEGAHFERWQVSAFYTAPVLMALAGFAAGLVLLTARLRTRAATGVP